MSTEVNLAAFEYIVSKIDDGFLFEKLGQDLCCLIVGIDFVPVGGVKDRGIDGLEHVQEQQGDGKTVYQFSIEADPRQKVLKTCKALTANKIETSRLYYVTNQIVKDKDTIEEEAYTAHKVTVIIRDLNWLRGNVAKSENTIRVYGDFVGNHAHIIQSAPQNLEVLDFVNDPRVFVFLRQQFDQLSDDGKLREMLVDSLILFALEGTDPDKNAFNTAAEILSTVATAVKFPVSQIEGLLEQRLDFLSSLKPRKINHHPNPDRYCLPFQTRLKLDEQKAMDASLHDDFTKTSKTRLLKHLALQKIQIKNAEHILKQVFNRIFKRQGLDFASFLLNQKNQTAVDGALLDSINAVIDVSGVAQPNKILAAAALQATMREIIYQGTNRELEYLQKLSNTYMLLFLIQCEPKVCSYFDALASNLTVFVCNSILVPAISEIALPKENRRHWNLLNRARDAGVKIYANRVTLDELVGHVQKSLRRYYEFHEGNEGVYANELILPYVDLILVRAFLYERTRGHQGTFEQFVDKFVSPRAPTARMTQELAVFIKDELGVEFIDDAALGIEVDQQRVIALETELKEFKGEVKARSDAKTILSIYALRAKHNETGSFGLFSYRTWWLSKDTSTHRAVISCFKGNAPESCYLRPDFLLNYIALSCRGSQASKVFDDMFPTLIGVSLSHHVPQEVSEAMEIVLTRHKNTPISRRKAIMSSSVTQLMVEGKGRKTKDLVHFLDEKFQAHS